MRTAFQSVAATALLYLVGCMPAGDPKKPSTPPARGEVNNGSPDEKPSSRPASVFPEGLLDRPQVQVASERPGSPWSIVRDALLEAESDPTSAEVAADLVRLSGPTDLRAPAFENHVAALASGTATTFEGAIALLELVESRPTFDPAFAAHVWRRVRGTVPTTSEDGQRRVELYQRLAQHVRVCEALAAASGGSNSPAPSAGPGLADDAVETANATARARSEDAKQRFDARPRLANDPLQLTLRVQTGNVTIATASGVVFAPGQSFPLARLDVMSCSEGCTLEVAGFLATLVAGQEATLFDLLGRFDPADVQRLRDRVALAAGGDDVALDEVRRLIGLVHPLVRSQDGLSPNGGLQELLQAFDGALSADRLP